LKPQPSPLPHVIGRIVAESDSFGMRNDAFTNWLRSHLKRIHGLLISGSGRDPGQIRVFQPGCTDDLLEIVEQFLNDTSFMKEFLGCMDDETKCICEWQLLGYTIDQIAQELRTTSNHLSVRYIAGLGRAALRVLAIKHQSAACAKISENIHNAQSAAPQDGAMADSTLSHLHHDRLISTVLEKRKPS